MDLSRCVTCPTQLNPSQVRNGMRRCAACRKAHPGRLYTTGWKTSTKGHAWMILAGTGRLPSKPVSVESWWMNTPQAGFTATSEAHSIKAHAGPVRERGLYIEAKRERGLEEPRTTLDAASTLGNYD